MHQRVWHGIVPCPGINRCEFYKPGEVNHPLQHEVSKIVNEVENTQVYTNNDIKLVLSNKDNKRLSGTFLDNLTPVPFDPKLDPPQMTACFNCWHKNHKLEDCYSTKRNKFCCNCGRKYVIVADCPRCKKAYWEYIEEQEYIQAKIEMYGDVETAKYYEKRKEPEQFKPAKKPSPPQSKTTRKKNDFWSANSYGNDSRNNIARNTKTTGFVSSNGKESQYEDEYKNDYQDAPLTLVRGFKTMNFNAKEKEEQERIYTSQHMMDSKKENENYKEHIETNKFVTGSDQTNKFATCTTNSKFGTGSDQFNCKELKKTEDESDFHNNALVRSNLEDEDEDLKDMIFVDEDDPVESNAVELNVSEESNQEYKNFLSRIENLSEEAQKVAIRLFLNSQKKYNQV